MSSSRTECLQGGPLPVINGVITPRVKSPQ